MHQLSTTLCGFVRNLSKSVISPLSKSHEVPLKLITLVCLKSLVPKYFVVLSKGELKTENRLSTFVVGRFNFTNLDTNFWVRISKLHDSLFYLVNFTESQLNQYCCAISFLSTLKQRHLPDKTIDIKTDSQKLKIKLKIFLKVDSIWI